MSPTITTDDIANELVDLMRFARSLVRNEERAADLVQDTAVRAIERSDQFRSDGSLGAWLRQILHHLAIDQGKRSARELAVDQVEAEWHDDLNSVDPAVIVERSAVREDLEDALARLPFAYRTAVILHDAEGWTMSEVAELEDIELPAAKQRLRRGRMMLVNALAGGSLRRTVTKGVPMRCWDARKHVSDYMNGSLEAELARTVEAHLEVCPTCPPLYAALVGVRDNMGALRDDNRVIAPEVEERIRTVLAND